jgi:hypothetical protein
VIPPPIEAWGGRDPAVVSDTAVWRGSGDATSTVCGQRTAGGAGGGSATNIKRR